MDKPEPTDNELALNFAQNGDESAFDELYSRFKDKVYRKCLAYLRNETDAEDAVQDVWTRIYQALPRFEGKSAFGTWVYRIAVNVCINRIKRGKTFVFFDETHPDIKKLESKSGDISNNEDVTKLLECLSKLSRTLLLLKIVDGYEYEEIAKMTGLGESAIKMRISRAKAALRKALLENE